VGGDAPRRRPEVSAESLSPRVVRVRIDEPALDKAFDYLVPESIGDQVRVGTVVRVELHGRRVGGWVIEDGVEPPEGVALKPIAKVTGWGPAADVSALAEWAAWRWAGQPAHFLRTASANAAVRGLPAPAHPVHAQGVDDALAAEALRDGRAVLRLPPSADLFGLVLQAAAFGPALVVCSSHAQERHLAARLRRAGLVVAQVPRDWAQARAGAHVVIGARAAAWAPVDGLAAVVVLDEHEEVHQEEASPTWHARDVAIERAARAGVPCVVTSPTPSLAALAWGRLVTPSRTVERAGWPVVDVVDRKREDPLRSDLYSEKLVDLVRSGKRVVCVLNRKGRAALLMCTVCDELARCEACGAAVAMGENELVCRRCATTRPVICHSCGSAKLKQRRLGVTRAREDLERLARVPVGEVTGDSADLPDTRVLVGTEAVLRRMESADAVAFLDLDAELLAPRYRAGEEAMALVARAARLVGGKDRGRVLLQTRQPKHEVVQAALLADPARASDVELERRVILRFPPVAALAHVSGGPATQYVDGLVGRLDVDVLGPAADGSYLVRAADVPTLCDALAEIPRPPGRLRVAVDPLRL
jgi:primosomal protein N' (replication factor Y)